MPKKSKKSFNEYDLLQKERGFMELEEGEKAEQHHIQQQVDVTSATKHFDLHLESFGPYKIDYSLNGRHLLMGGVKGHLAAFDWQSKRLTCEINVMESIHDVKWLHRENMFAVAQKQWTYIYDNNGIELHCLKMLDSVLKMDFLPYHFLLATSSAKSYLSWLDVSIGKMVSGVATGLGRLSVMTHNPQNAIVVLGHNAGTVTMWSPNVKESLVKMMCHVGSVNDVAVSKNGCYMATTGSDSSIKIWDLRNYKLLSSAHFPSFHKSPAHLFSGPAHHLAFSQTDLLAVAFSNGVSVYNHVTSGSHVDVKNPYLSHAVKLPGVGGVSFCPHEDVLGVGHSLGFTSLLVPGAGEANYDALEVNPHESKKQVREAEVKRLLNKIQPELISLETKGLSKLDQDSAKQIMQQRINNKFLKAPKRDRSGVGHGGVKGRRGGGGKKMEGQERDYRRKMLKMNEKKKKNNNNNDDNSNNNNNNNNNNKKSNPLDRFKKKRFVNDS